VGTTTPACPQSASPLLSLHSQTKDETGTNAAAGVKGSRAAPPSPRTVKDPAPRKKEEPFPSSNANGTRPRRGKGRQQQ